MAPDTEERYGLTWRVTPDLLGILSPSGLFEATNPAWLETLGYEADEIERQPFFNFIHQDDIPSTEEAFEQIQQGHPVLQFRNRYRHKHRPKTHGSAATDPRTSSATGSQAGRSPGFEQGGDGIGATGIEGHG